MTVVFLSLSNGPGQHRIPISLLRLYVSVGYGELGLSRRQQI